MADLTVTNQQRMTETTPKKAQALSVAQFFEDGDGNLSSTRLGFLLWTVGVLAVWVSASLHGHMAEIPTSVQVVLGIYSAGKVTQRAIEGKSTTDSSNQ